MHFNMIDMSSFSSPRITECKKFEINKSMVEAFLNIGMGIQSWSVEPFSISLGISTIDGKLLTNMFYSMQKNGKLFVKKILQTARTKVREMHALFGSTS